MSVGPSLFSLLSLLQKVLQKLISNNIFYYIIILLGALLLYLRNKLILLMCSIKFALTSDTSMHLGFIG